MKRRLFLAGLGATAVASYGFFYRMIPAAAVDMSVTVERLKKPHHEWRKLVPPEAYKVLFEEHTEPPGSSALYHEHRDGTYLCAA